MKVSPQSIKSMNPVRKHPHITDLFACIVNMFIFMLL